MIGDEPRPPLPPLAPPATTPAQELAFWRRSLIELERMRNDALNGATFWSEEAERRCAALESLARDRIAGLERRIAGGAAAPVRTPLETPCDAKGQGGGL